MSKSTSGGRRVSPVLPGTEPVAATATIATSASTTSAGTRARRELRPIGPSLVASGRESSSVYAAGAGTGGDEVADLPSQ